MFYVSDDNSLDTLHINLPDVDESLETGAYSFYGGRIHHINKRDAIDVTIRNISAPANQSKDDTKITETSNLTNDTATKTVETTATSVVTNETVVKTTTIESLLETTSTPAMNTTTEQTYNTTTYSETTETPTTLGLKPEVCKIIGKMYF